VTALREAIAARPEPRQEGAAGLVFVTTRGRPWLSRGIANPVSVAVRSLMKSIGIHDEGIGFYTLRHVFRTVADAARDPVAIDLIMGHSDPSMAAHYRERVEDSRLQAVAEHVRHWLFGKNPDGTGAPADEAPTDTVLAICDPSKPAPEHTELGGVQSVAAPPMLRLYVG
jgi:hypothetical protein